MKLSDFEQAGQARWRDLDDLVRRAGRRPERLGSEGVRLLASLYRAAAADLATARTRFPGDPIVGRLERLVTTARALVYERAGRRGNLLQFFTDTYWVLLWQRRRALATVAALLLLPAILGWTWALRDPETVTALVPAEFLWVTEVRSTDLGASLVGLAGFSFFVLTNNVRVALFAFALGVTWGIGTGWVVGYNGLTLGLIGGLAMGAGNLEVLVAALIAHGMLELSCIVVAGTAGLSLARAILRPGKKTRRAALAAEAPAAFMIAGGTGAWLVVAGFIEGYASRQGFGWAPTTLIGLSVGAAFWGLWWWRGRKSPTRRQVTASP
jgi:uncharacterized membrane protein SpoIIM required for sporulation